MPSTQPSQSTEQSIQVKHQDRIYKLTPLTMQEQEKHSTDLWHLRPPQRSTKKPLQKYAEHAHRRFTPTERNTREGLKIASSVVGGMLAGAGIALGATALAIRQKGQRWNARKGIFESVSSSDSRLSDNE